MSSYLHVLNSVCEKVHETMVDKGKDEIEWSVEVEILFSYAMIGLKPVGVNRHFMMACIHNRFSNYINRQITSKPIWDHLDSLYDMAALHESEIIPFPNEEKEFELPEDEFAELMNKKRAEVASKADPDADVKKEETTKAGKKVFVKPRPVQSLGQAKETTSSKSSPSPVSGKTTKAQVSAKTESGGATNNSTGESTKIKSKPDAQPAKVFKAKASASQVGSKTPKTEATSGSQVKGNSPADGLPQKAKVSSGSPTKKPSIKQEKNDTGDVKRAKEVTPDRSRKSSVTKETVGRRKDSGPKKNADGHSAKFGKSDRSPAGTPTKSVKFEKDDSESSSSKSSRGQAKNENADKKTRRTKVDESPAKKTNSTLKRRRVN